MFPSPVVDFSVLFHVLSLCGSSYEREFCCNERSENYLHVVILTEVTNNQDSL